MDELLALERSIDRLGSDLSSKAPLSAEREIAFRDLKNLIKIRHRVSLECHLAALDERRRSGESVTS